MASDKIFVVDDEPLLAEVVKRFLAGEGYEAEIATSAREALRKISADIRGYAAVVTDNNMPEMSGLELVQELRKAGFSGKIIMFSGNVAPGDEPRFRASGADLVLRKPSELKLLVPAIQNAFGHWG
jgi:CheY-like chemotaxis protein